MAEQGKYERLNDVLKKLEKPTAFEFAVVRALHDIHRYVIEEPWFGRTVHDVVSYYNQRLGKEASLTQEPAQQPENTEEAAQERDTAQTLTTEPSFTHDYNPDSFYGRGHEQRRSGDRAADTHGKEQEAHSQEHERERNRGMER